jgi:hypothetical protein
MQKAQDFVLATPANIGQWIILVIAGTGNCAVTDPTAIVDFGPKPKFDPATNRHYIERFVSLAARTTNVSSSNSSETLFLKVMERYRDSHDGIALLDTEHGGAMVDDKNDKMTRPKNDGA